MNNEKYLIKLKASLKKILSSQTVIPVVVCIGSDRATGDCLGPLVGEMLVSLGAPLFVYGTLSSPVTALNIRGVLSFVLRRHVGSTIIAVDSSLGKADDVGKIKLTRGGIKPGLATGKNLPGVGDWAVTGIIAPYGEENKIASLRLGEISALARKIADLIISSSGARRLAPRKESNFPIPLNNTPTK